MTTRLQAAEALAQVFVTTWGPYPYHLEGDPDFVPPDGPWARFTAREELSAQDTLGATGTRQFARRGRAFVQVFDLVGRGSKTARDLAQAVAAGFEGTTLDDTTVHVQAVTVRGPTVDDGWLQMTVDIPFTHYETR